MNNNSINYCALCGKKLIKRQTEYFDTETGKPEFEKICSNLKCKSGCGANGHIWERVGGFLSFDKECERCGEGKYISNFY